MESATRLLRQVFLTDLQTLAHLQILLFKAAQVRLKAPGILEGGLVRRDEEVLHHIVPTVARLAAEIVGSADPLHLYSIVARTRKRDDTDDAVASPYRITRSVHRCEVTGSVGGTVKSHLVLDPGEGLGIIDPATKAPELKVQMIGSISCGGLNLDDVVAHPETDMERSLSGVIVVDVHLRDNRRVIARRRHRSDPEEEPDEAVNHGEERDDADDAGQPAAKPLKCLHVASARQDDALIAASSTT